jgi:hypothetical protein
MKSLELRKLIREEVRKVLKEANGSLDPNATYKVDIGTSRGEFDPSDVKKLSGQPLMAAKAVLKMVYKDYEDADYSEEEISEYVSAVKLDEYTYYIMTGEEDVTIVGSPKSSTYGKFWSLVGTNPDAAESIFRKMDKATISAKEIGL